MGYNLVWSIALYGSESWTVKKCDEKRIMAFELWCWRRVLRISWTEYKTNVSVRQKIGVPEQNGLLEQLKKRKLAKYGHWKRRSEGLVIEIEGKCLPGRRRTAWIDNVGRWTEGGLPAARRIALARLWQMWTEKQKNIVVRCLRPYKGYGLLRERVCAWMSRFPTTQYRCTMVVTLLDTRPGIILQTLRW